MEHEHGLIRDLALNNQNMELLADYRVVLQTVYFVDPVSGGLGQQPLSAVARVEP